MFIVMPLAVRSRSHNRMMHFQAAEIKQRDGWCNLTAQRGMSLLLQMHAQLIAQ